MSETKDKPEVASRGAATTFQSIEQKQRAGIEGNEGGEETAEAKATREAAEAADAEKYKGLSPDEITAKKAEETAALAEAEKNKLPDLSEDQIKALLAKQGIKVEGTLEELKAKLNPAAELTEEEKRKIETEKELAAQQLYLTLDPANTIEKFAALKSVAAMDEKELSEKSLKNELKAAGFDDDEIKEIIKQRYFQIDIETLEPGLEEDEKDFEKRKALLAKQAKYGATKLENRGKNAKSHAASELGNLYKAIELSNQQKLDDEKEEKLLSSTIDEIFQKAPKKLTVELGKDSAEADIPPIEHEVFDKDIADVKELLTDATKRKQFLYNESGDLNVQNIVNTLIENATMKKQLKVVYLSGVDRTTELFAKVFPHRTAQGLGLGGNSAANNNGHKNQPASRGKVQRVN